MKRKNKSTVDKETYDFLTEVEAMLYAVNTSNHCGNPPHDSWVRSYSMTDPSRYVVPQQHIDEFLDATI